MKAPMMMIANETASSLADFWGDDGPSSKLELRKDNYKNRKNNNTSTANSNSVPDILNWISKVTIKRRKFRRQSRCSNLLAEAVLSSTLKQAKEELSVKQEEKRRKAQEFSYQLSIHVSQAERDADKYYIDSSQEDEMDTTNSSPTSNYNTDSSNNYLSGTEKYNNSCSTNYRKDEHVQACISSLDNFFSELKSIKV